VYLLWRGPGVVASLAPRNASSPASATRPFSIFFILGIFVRIGESNHLHAAVTLMELHEELANVRYGQSAARRSLEFCLSPMATQLLKSVLLKGVSIAIHLRTRDPGGTRWRSSLTIPA
jgi:hypothetical protein